MSINTVEQHSVIKSNVVVTYAATWMSPENMLSEGRQAGPPIVWSRLCEMSRRDKSTETESRFTVTRGREREKWRMAVKRGWGLSWSDDKIFWNYLEVVVAQDSQVALVVKNLPACNAGAAGDLGLIPRLGIKPIAGGGHGNPLQYSCLGNPMDRGAWQATVHGVAKSWT